MEIRFEKVLADGWRMESEGNLAGRPEWHWETWVSPDNEYMATFYAGTFTATVERWE